MAFGGQSADVKLAFERLGKALEPFDVNFKQLVWTSVYPVTPAVADTFRGIRFDFEDKDHPPASALLLFEGLPSLDASVAFELIGVPAN